ncbi:hypothetical protein HDU67_005990 [Dinochytrium kinnereticum]|nr:hypothetical protein HDU67_005990 [Dinochytrium kinnereticum]
MEFCTPGERLGLLEQYTHLGLRNEKRTCRGDHIYSSVVGIRQEEEDPTRDADVRSTERDKIQIYKCFRPGDIVSLIILRSRPHDDSYLMGGDDLPQDKGD